MRVRAHPRLSVHVYAHVRVLCLRRVNKGVCAQCTRKGVHVRECACMQISAEGVKGWMSG